MAAAQQSSPAQHVQPTILQHVSVPSHIRGNVLDMILLQDGDASSPLVSVVSVQCPVDLLLQPPPVDMSSLRAADATCCDDVQLSLAV